MRNFGVISWPLTEMLKKNVVFVWTEDKEAAFQALKEALVSAPVLELSDFTKMFEVEMDASDKGIRAILMQDRHHVAYLNKALSPRTRAVYI